MPLAAIPMLLPAIIGAGASVGTALINKSGRSSGSSGSLLPPGLDQNALKGLIDKQTGIADWFNTEGKATLGQGKDILQGPIDYLTPLLKGDRTAMMEAQAPEIAAINAEFRQPLKDAQLTGRGSSLAPDLEAGRQSAISEMFFKARPIASDKLTAIAQGQMNLGTQQVGLGAGVLQDAASETLNYNSLIRGIQAQTRGDSAALWTALGDSFGPTLAEILKGVFGNSTGSSGGGSPTSTTHEGGHANSGIDIASLITSLQGAPEINASWLPNDNHKGL